MDLVIRLKQPVYLEFVLEVVHVLQMVTVIGGLTAHERIVIIDDFLVRQTIVVIVIGRTEQMIHFVRSHFTVIKKKTNRI